MTDSEISKHSITSSSKCTWSANLIIKALIFILRSMKAIIQLELTVIFWVIGYWLLSWGIGGDWSGISLGRFGGRCGRGVWSGGTDFIVCWWGRCERLTECEAMGRKADVMRLCLGHVLVDEEVQSMCWVGEEVKYFWEQWVFCGYGWCVWGFVKRVCRLGGRIGAYGWIFGIL